MTFFVHTKTNTIRLFHTKNSKKACFGSVYLLLELNIIILFDTLCELFNSQAE